MDLAIIGGNVLTMNSQNIRAEAVWTTRAGGRGTAPAREDGVIVRVGKEPLDAAPIVWPGQDWLLALSPGPHHVY